MTGLRKYVEECSNKLKLSVEHGYHNLNLALLFLRLHEHRRAIDYAEKALSDLPGRSDAYYFEALIRAAGAPLLVLPHASARQIMRSLDTAIHLGIESLPKSRSAGAGLPWLLKAIIAHDYYARKRPHSTYGTARSAFARDAFARARRAGIRPAFRQLIRSVRLEF